MDCQKGQHGQLLIIDRALLPPTTHKFWGDFWCCILWTSNIKIKLNTSTDWWKRQATIQHSSVEIITPIIEWNDRPVDRKRWAMVNKSVELCICMPQQAIHRIDYPQWVCFFNLCDRIPSYTLQIALYESQVSQHIIP